MSKVKIYLVIEGYEDDMEIVAAFSTYKLANEWIIKESVHRRNQDESYNKRYTLQYFTDWFRILKIPFYEEH